MQIKLPPKEKIDVAIHQSVQESMAGMCDELRDNFSIKLDDNGSFSIGGLFTEGIYPRTLKEESEIHSFTCAWCGTHDTTRNLRGQLECCGCAHPVQLQKQNRSTRYAPVVNFNVREAFTDEEISLAMRSILSEL